MQNKIEWKQDTVCTRVSMKQSWLGEHSLPFVEMQCQSLQKQARALCIHTHPPWKWCFNILLGSSFCSFGSEFLQNKYPCAPPPEAGWFPISSISTQNIEHTGPFKSKERNSSILSMQCSDSFYTPRRGLLFRYCTVHSFVRVLVLNIFTHIICKEININSIRYNNTTVCTC